MKKIMHAYTYMNINAYRIIGLHHFVLSWQIWVCDFFVFFFYNFSFLLFAFYFFFAFSIKNKPLFFTWVFYRFLFCQSIKYFLKKQKKKFFSFHFVATYFLFYFCNVLVYHFLFRVYFSLHSFQSCNILVDFFILSLLAFQFYFFIILFVCNALAWVLHLIDQ